MRLDLIFHEISLSSDKNLSKTKILSAFANKNVKIFTELEGKIILEVTNTKDKNQNY